MAELIVSPIVKILLENLATYLKDQYKLSSDVKKKLKKMEESLNHIQAVARAADEVEIEKNEHLADWLRELKDAAYEAEDVLDEVGNAVAPADEDDGGGRNNAKACFFFFLVKYFKRFTQYREFLENLRRVQTRFKGLAAGTRDFLNLVGRMDDGGEQSSETASFIRESKLEFVGRKEELEQIINQLVVRGDGSQSSTSDWGVPVLPLVGPGGSGKTTLAQHVFNDPRVQKHFGKKIWVHVSQNFDVKRLTREMIQSAQGNKCDVENLDRLQQSLKKALGLKRFLLVLDDMWCDEKTEQDWRTLFAPVADGARGRGSIIFLTSRTTQVACLPGAFDPIPLRLLDGNECWSIMKACVFGGDSTPDGCENLVEIGMQIAFKVEGSPLAAKAVSGMLRVNWDDVYWSRILDNGLAELPGVMDVLKLSYRHLPPHLRKCFAYCSLFPKGHKFDPDNIGCMWVALDFIRPGPGETMKETGRKCFNDLLSRSFFQIEANSESYYIMHDLINDLARKVSSGDCLRFEGANNLSQDNILKTVRHISVGSDHLAELSKKGCNFANLRTFLFFANDKFDVEVLTEILKQLRCVRVLVIDGESDVRVAGGDSRVKELPDVVSGWIHLRLLDISRTRIVGLPKCSRLYHLQVLSVASYWEFREEMNNLRILDTRSKSFVNSQIAFIGRLTSLEELNGTFCVRKTTGCEIRQLRDLNGLRGSLTIEGLQNVESMQEAEGANLCGKGWLTELSLDWGYARTAQLQEEVLEALQPPSHLKRLTIKSYQGSTCPSWMCNQWLSKLNSIYLDMSKLVRLPPLGQLPFLKSLTMSALYKVKEFGRYQSGGSGGDAIWFPSLEELTISDMFELEQWSVPDGDQWFPRLRKLQIHNCGKLRSLPPLAQLPSLKVLGMKNLVTVKELGLYQSGGNGGDARWFPSLEELKINFMPELEQLCSVPDDGEWFPRLQKLEIYRCPKLRSLPPVAQLPSLKILRMIDLDTVKEFGLCQSGGRGGDDIRWFPSLEELNIWNMPAWEEWGSGLVDGQWFSNLREFRIQTCPNLITVPTLSPTLTDMHISDVGLFALPGLCEYCDDAWMSDSASISSSSKLFWLSIISCPNLRSLGESLLQHRLKHLQRLDIRACEQLLSLPDRGFRELISLETLAMRNCPRLTWPTQNKEEDGGPLPSSLKSLVVEACGDLGDGALSGCLQGLSNLYGLRICRCMCLASLPPAELLCHLTMLQVLIVVDCEALTPSGLAGIQALVSLKELAIKGCPGLLSSVTTADVVGRTFSSPIERLRIDNLLMLTTVPILKTLTTLQELSITSSFRGTSFPPEVELLLRNCTSLKSFVLNGAPKLQSLPDLPNTLEILRIHPGNEELERRYEEDVGPDWHKIQHIKEIYITDPIMPFPRSLIQILYPESQHTGSGIGRCPFQEGARRLSLNRTSDLERDFYNGDLEYYDDVDRDDKYQLRNHHGLLI